MPTLLAAAEIVVAENEQAGAGGIFPPLRFVKTLLPSLSLVRFCLLRPLVSRLISSLFPLSFPALLPREKMIHDLLISQNSLAT